jgi:alkanesulfonate monooxygenase SsuD/methylene tetrahydromethanopterin reductase-like flavin-dependent oxidoreductase (luciferase family)
VAKLRGLVEKEGRDPAKVALAYRVQKYGPEVPATAGDGERRLFSGTPGQIADDLKALRDLGVVAVDLTFPGVTVEEVIASLRDFRETVMAKL